MMMWKLKKKVSQKTEKKNYGHFLTALKSFKNPRELHHYLRHLKISNTEKKRRHYLKVFNTEKRLHCFLRTLKVFNIEKGLHHFLEARKGFNFEKYMLITRKVYQNNYSVLCWWAAASEGPLFYHIYD